MVFWSVLTSPQEMGIPLWNQKAMALHQREMFRIYSYEWRTQSLTVGLQLDVATVGGPLSVVKVYIYFYAMCKNRISIKFGKIRWSPIGCEGFHTHILNIPRPLSPLSPLSPLPTTIFNLWRILSIARMQIEYVELKHVELIMISPKISTAATHGKMRTVDMSLWAADKTLGLFIKV